MAISSISRSQFPIRFTPGAITAKTIASGAIDVTGSGVYALLVESGTSDDLDTITGGVPGMILVLGLGVANSTVRLRNSAVANGILCLRSITLQTSSDSVTLFYNGGQWLVTACYDGSVNG